MLDCDGGGDGLGTLKVMATAARVERNTLKATAAEVVRDDGRATATAAAASARELRGGGDVAAAESATAESATAATWSEGRPAAVALGHRWSGVLPSGRGRTLRRTNRSGTNGGARNGDKCGGTHQRGSLGEPAGGGCGVRDDKRRRWWSTAHHQRRRQRGIPQQRMDDREGNHREGARGAPRTERCGRCDKSGGIG